MKKYLVIICLMVGLTASAQNGEVLSVLKLEPQATAPTNAFWTNGSLYRHTDGTIYHKVGGSWVPFGGASSFSTITGSARDNADLDAELDLKQDVLVSGTSIKTINSTSLLGSGNIVISGGSMDWSTPVDSNITFDADNTYDIGTNSVGAGTIYAGLFSGNIEASAGEIDNISTATVNIFGRSTDLTPGSYPLNSSVIYHNYTDDRTKTAVNGAIKTFAWLDDITSSNLADGSISTAKLADNAVTSTKILDGTILNADINASAGIAATKIAYDNSTSGTSEDDMQGVADEIYANMGTLTSNIAANAVDIALNETTIDSITTVLSTVATSAYDFNIKTAPYELTIDDAKDNVIVELDYNDEALTVPSGVFSPGQAVSIEYAYGGVGDANIIEGLGTSILGYTDGVTLSDYGSGFILVRHTSATSPETFKVVKPYGTLTDYVVAGCTPDANEHYTTANAASDPNCNEADATTGWTTGGTGTTITTSTDSTDGTYSLVVNTTGGVPAWAQFNFSVTSGDEYTISFNAKKAEADYDTKITNWTGLTGSPSSVNITQSWVTYSYDVTASSTGTATIRFYASSGSGGSSGDKFYADNISIIKTN